MDTNTRKRSNRTALAIACAAAIPALCTLFVASAEDRHRGAPEADVTPATLDAPRLVRQPGVEAAVHPSLERHFELPLQPGEFEWHPQASLAGDVVVLVSLPMQEIHVYRGGIRIGRASISSGKAGKDTPVGAFPILQKRKVHHSSLYDDAPMPYMQRLTWDGIALHAGRNPGYPASHGCIRLPREFAEDLYAVTDHGQVVVVGDYTMFGDDVLAPGPVAPPRLLAVARAALETDEHAEDVAGL